MNEAIRLVKHDLLKVYDFLTSSGQEAVSWFGRRVTWLIDTTGLPTTSLWKNTTPHVNSVWSSVQPHFETTVRFLRTGNGVGLSLMLITGYYLYQRLGKGLLPRISQGAEPPVELEPLRPPSKGKNLVTTISYVSLFMLAGVAFSYGESRVF